MKLHTGKDFKPVHVAAGIVKAFSVYADGKKVFETDNNYVSLVKIPLGLTAKEVRIEWHQTHGADKVRLFAADFIEG